MHESWKLIITLTHIHLKAIHENEVLTSELLLDIEKEDYEKNFDEVPPPFTQKEREEWLKELRGVAVSSDAFVSHDHGMLLYND